jgi:hypothetical protein
MLHIAKESNLTLIRAIIYLTQQVGVRYDLPLLSVKGYFYAYSPRQP